MENEISRYSSEALQYACERNDCKLRAFYSGRGMYGDECFGIVGDRHDIENALLDALDYDPHVKSELRKIYRNKRYDSMGMDKICYFPGYLLDNDFVDEMEL